MNEQRMQFAIGVVTILAGFALAAIIIWFGEFQFVLQPRKTYYVLFKSAPGAEPKVPVRRAGIRIGEITRVEYSEKYSLVVCTIVIEGENELREGDEPTLTRSLLGDTYLDIETRFDMRGKPDRAVYPPETTFEGRAPLDTMRTIEKTAELVPNANRTIVEMEKTSQQWTEVGLRANRLLADNEERINQILEQTRDSTERLATTLESINNILEPKTQENLKVTLQNLRDSSNDLRPLIQSSQQSINQITETTRKMDDVARNLQSATKPLAERSDKTMRNLDEGSQQLNELLTDLRVLVKQYRSQDGTFQRMTADPTLYQNLDEASQLLIRNLTELERVLRDLKVFSDKIARHPGELGVQGVFTRDTGVKNAEPGAKTGLLRRGGHD